MRARAYVLHSRYPGGKDNPVPLCADLQDANLQLILLCKKSFHRVSQLVRPFMLFSVFHAGTTQPRAKQA